MISVVIPTLNSEETLPATLMALIPAAVEGLVREVIIADGGSTDRTHGVADGSGADFLVCRTGRGVQLAAGAAKARSPWLLFLHSDTVLQGEWMHDVSDFMRDVDLAKCPPAAAAFRFKLDDSGARPRILEVLVALRCRFLRLPYGDQGLLISRALYNEIGGFKNLPIMEDVDFIRRLGRRRVALLPSAALTSPARYKREGYVLRSLRNQVCLWLYIFGMPAEKISPIYGRRAPQPE